MERQDPATIDPRISVVAALAGYCVLMMGVGLLTAALIATHVAKIGAVSGLLLGLITLVGMGAMIQTARAAIVLYALRRVRMGKWQPKTNWRTALAYPQDADFVLQVVAICAVMIAVK